MVVASESVWTLDGVFSSKCKDELYWHYSLDSSPLAITSVFSFAVACYMPCSSFHLSQCVGCFSLLLARVWHIFP